MKRIRLCYSGRRGALLTCATALLLWASLAVGSSDPQPLSQTDQMYHVLVAEFAVRRGHLPIAVEHYRAVVDLSDDPSLAERAARIALHIDDRAALLPFARRWQHLAPDDHQAVQTLVLALLKHAEIDSAMGYLDQVRDVFAERDSQDGFAGLYNLLDQVEAQTRLQALEQLAARHTDSAFAVYYAALAALDVEQIDTALDYLEQAVQQRPDWREALLVQARVRLQAEQEPQALAGLAAAVEANPDDSELRLGYARILIAADQLDQAREQFAQLAAAQPDDAQALFALGVLATETEQYDMAEEHFQRLLASNQRVAETTFELARLNELRGDYAEALAWYAQVETDDRYLNAQIRAAAMEARLDKFSAVVERFVRLRSEYPDNRVSLYITEAEVLREVGQYQAAYEVLDAALQDYPDNHDLLYSRALAAERLDQLDQLEQDLRRIIADDPAHAHALNALGYTLTDRTDRHEEAYDLIRQALDLLPDDPAILDSMGWVKYHLGDLQAALPYLRRAHDISADPEITMHLSQVLWDLGQHDEAREIWETAYEQYPENEYLLRLKALFRP